MKTEYIKVTPDSAEALGRAGEIIRRGGLVAFPTETVYGLGGNALTRRLPKKYLQPKAARVTIL